MRRQLSTRLENAFQYLTFRRGLSDSNTLQQASNIFSSRSKPVAIIDSDWYQRQCQHNQRRQRRRYYCHHAFNVKKMNYNRFHQDHVFFDDLRACYFSSAAERISTNEDERVDSDSNDPASINTRHSSGPTSTQLDHIVVGDEDLNKVNYVTTLKSWYFDNYGESGVVLQNAFETKMIRNPNNRSVVSEVHGDVDEDDVSINYADVVDIIHAVISVTPLELAGVFVELVLLSLPLHNSFLLGELLPPR